MEYRHLLISFADEQLKATIEDNATTRDFIEQLSMTINMHDLFNREKYAEISGLTVENTNTPHYSKGDISFYTPMETFVIYYKGDQEPLNGLVKMGEILKGVEILEDYPGDIEVTIDIE
ncbi:cyclophilin-like fold protein [Salicibibacter halophilus]|nr:cyclophilin-like fold protein [Salicibibacter halophilus]